MKNKDSLNNIVLAIVFAAVVNLIGVVGWTALVMLVMYAIQGAVKFIMEYALVIILIIAAVIWLKKKLRL